MSLLPYDRDELYALYLNAGSIKELAKQFDLPKWFVIYELSMIGIFGDIPNIALSENEKLDRDKLRNDLRILHSIKKISGNLGRSEYSIRKDLVKYGIFKSTWVRAKPYQWIESELKEDFETFGTIKEIAIKYNCHRKTLIRALEKFGIIYTEEKKKFGRVQYKFTKEQLTEDYNELQSLTAIANKYGCSLYTIWKACKKLNVIYPHMKEMHG